MGREWSRLQGIYIDLGRECLVGVGVGRDGREGYKGSIKEWSRKGVE